jgi:superfamily II DNA or RNA helicase
MWLTINNINTKLSNASDDERRWLREYLSFENEKARFFRGRFASKTDGRMYMFSLFTESFPSGFVPTVLDAASREGFTVQLIDRRVRPCEPDPQADLAWLRDYQLTGVDKVVEKARGMLWMPTGSGKTEVFAGLTRRLPCRWLFLVHRTTLVDQAAERVERRTGLRVGRCGEGRWDGFAQSDGIVCATFQTMAARLGKRDPDAEALLEQAQGLAVDEAHTLPAESFLKVVNGCRNAYWRVGLSGTPLARGDRRSVVAVGALGKVIYRIKPQVLIDAGVLAKPRIHMLPVYQESDKPTWQGVYGECVVRSAVRNRTVVEATRQADKPCLVFVKEVKHGKTLNAMLAKAGLSSEFVWGTHSSEWRQSLIKRLQTGALDVLVCSVIFQEGVDIPDLRAVVIASGGKSVIASLQRIGRGMRIAKGKDTFEVWDLDDRGQKMLARHTRGRLGAYASEGFEVVQEVQLVPGVVV